MIGQRLMMTRSPRRLAGLAEIAEAFDAAILDQWGVLYDGANAPPGAVAALSAMAAAGKRAMVLSNSARLGTDSYDRLAGLGFDQAAIAGIVTSGEVVRALLEARDDPFFASLGRRVLMIARDHTLIEDLNYEAVDTPELADFVLLGSSTAPEMSLAADHAPVLALAASRGIPLICANPDRIGVAASGLTEGPGTLAAFYEGRGGLVRYIGKPYPEVYARASALLGHPPADRVLAVGDSLEHDIAGGRRAGCLTLFVESGIHATDLAAPDASAGLYAKFGVTPDFTIPRLVW
jgi:HAD superfamily hydrolase (TIGR01459 family)